MSSVCLCVHRVVLNRTTRVEFWCINRIEKSNFKQLKWVSECEIHSAWFNFKFIRFSWTHTHSATRTGEPTIHGPWESGKEYPTKTFEGEGKSMLFSTSTPPITEIFNLFSRNASLSSNYRISSQFHPKHRSCEKIGAEIKFKLNVFLLPHWA